MLLEWGSVPSLRALLGGPEWWDEPCIWSEKLLIWDPRLPPFDRRHVKNAFMPDSLFMRWRGQKGSLQPHGLNREASGACLEGRVQLNRWVRLGWVRLSRVAASQWPRGSTPNGGSTTMWPTELAPSAPSLPWRSRVWVWGQLPLWGSSSALAPGFGAAWLPHVELKAQL